VTLGQIILYALLGLVALVFLVFVYGGIKNRITRNKQMRIFTDTFSSKNFALPTIVGAYVYWWPTFKITFDSIASYQNAERQGLLTKFENEIGNIYGKEFDPKLAISYSYPDKVSN
jgi:hypothetical protein